MTIPQSKVKYSFWPENRNSKCLFNGFMNHVMNHSLFLSFSSIDRHILWKWLTAQILEPRLPGFKLALPVASYVSRQVP